MRTRILLGLVLLISSFALATQTMVTVTSSYIMDSAQNLLANGVIKFAPTDCAGNPLQYHMGGGGFAISRPVVAFIVGGAITTQVNGTTMKVADTSATAPQNVCFDVTITDTQAMYTFPTIHGVQPAANNAWCSSSVCNWDNFTPSITTLPLYGGGSSSAYTLPVATTSILGGVKAPNCSLLGSNYFPQSLNNDGTWNCVQTSTSGTFTWPSVIPSGTTIPWAQVTSQPTIPPAASNDSALGGTSPSSTVPPTQSAVENYVSNAIAGVSGGTGTSGGSSLSGTLYSSVQTRGGWQSCTGSGCAGGTNNTTAASGPTSDNTYTLDSQSMKFSATGTSADELWYLKLGAQNTASAFLWDHYVAWTSSGSQPQAVELDSFQFVSLYNYMMGTQCNFAAGSWDVWNYGSGGAWVHTSIPCTTSTFAPGVLHHVILATSDDKTAHTYTFNTLTIDGTVNTLNLTYNAKLMPAPWSDQVGVQYQLDATSAGQTNNLWVDESNFTAGVPGTGSATPLATSAPPMDGTAAVGTSTSAARADHVHPSDTTKANDSAVVHTTGNETAHGTKTFDTVVASAMTLGGSDLAGLLAAKQGSLGFTPENAANKGAANGYAALGSDGKVPAAQLPSGTVTPAGVSGDVQTNNGAGGFGALSQGSLAQNIGINCSVKLYGAVGNGTTDDSAAINTAQSSCPGGLVFPIGTYKVAANLTVTVPVYMQGGTFTMPTGVTLTLNGTVIAPTSLIFTLAGTAKVVIGISTPQVFAEWWGVTGTSDQVAINAALASSPGNTVRLLNAKTYSTSAAVVIPNSYTKLVGSGMRDTYITVNNATSDILTVAGTGNNCSAGGLFFNTVDGIDFSRTVSGSAGSKGINLTNTCWPLITNTESIDSQSDYYLNGTANSRFIRNIAQTSLTPTSARYGWEFDSTNGVPNASNYVIVSNTAVDATNGGGGGLGQMKGMYIHGAELNDIFVDRFETARCDYGVDIDGTQSSGSGIGHSDMHFTNLINDYSNFSAIRLTNVSGALATVEISGGWYASPSNGTNKLIDIENSTNVSISNLEIAYSTYGVYINGGGNNSVRGLTFNTVANPIELNATSGNIISNNTLSEPIGAGSGTIVKLTGSSYNTIAANALSGYASVGITLDATSTNNKLPGNVIKPTNITTLMADAGTGNAWDEYGPNGSAEGLTGASQLMLRHAVPVWVPLWTIFTNCAGSTMTAETAATASTVFSIQKCTGVGGTSCTQFGTATFAASGKVASFSCTATSFVGGTDSIKLIAPATPDASLAGLSYSIVGAR